MHTYVSLILLSLLSISFSVKAGAVAVSPEVSSSNVAATTCDYPCSDRGSGRRDFKPADVDTDKARGSGRRESEMPARKLANLG